MSRPLSYYQDLITSEQRDKPNFMSKLTANLQQGTDATNLLDNIYQCFDLDNINIENPLFIPSYITGYVSSVSIIHLTNGAQLDILGSLIGMSRIVDFNPADGSSSTLTDADYKTILKAKIAKNIWSGQIADLVQLWQILFPGTLIFVTDNQNMTMTVMLAGSFTAMTQDLITHGYIVPKPAGVGINYVYGHLPVFGYDSQDGYITGYDVGWWSDLR